MSMQRVPESSIAHNDAAGPVPVKPKRSAVACTRCRRYRSKCVASPPYSDPCANCVKNGVGSQCYFPARGEIDTERYRRRQAKSGLSGSSNDVPIAGSDSGAGLQNSSFTASSSSKATGLQSPNSSTGGKALRHTSLNAASPQDDRTGLPPIAEIIEAIENFSRCYFQISFLPQAFLLENVEEHPECISSFLQLAILTVAAQWTPSLVKRYGGANQAGDHFYNLAKAEIGAEMLKVSLQACQAFFLLSVFCWGRGNSEESTMLVGVAVRMVGVLQLHREGSYSLHPGASTEEITMSEVARRTFWAIITHEHLASGLNRLASPRLDEIDSLLPGDEGDFSFGVDTLQRPSLQGTIPHLADPSSATDSHRSLFATMVQSHSLWAKIAQWACRRTNDQPWMQGSAFWRLHEDLEGWYTGLAPRHKWSRQNLRGMAAEGKDIPFLSHITCYKLASVVLRRKYLASMAAVAEPDGTLDESVLAPAGFWNALAQDMVKRTWDLITTLEDFFRIRGTKLGFAPILIFALYISGSVALFLQRWPTLCPEEASQATIYLNTALATLSKLSQTWPMAEAWHDALCASVRNASTGTLGALKATAVAEKTADEAIGIFRHAQTAKAGTSPSFAIRPLASHSNNSVSPEARQPSAPAAIGQAVAPQEQGWQIPQQSSHTLSHLLTANTGAPEYAGSNVNMQHTTLPDSLFGNTSNLPALSQPYSNEVPSFLPLTREGVPYDAFEDDLIAFFRGEVPSYLDAFNFET